jgi:hypothetical protein
MWQFVKCTRYLHTENHSAPICCQAHILMWNYFLRYIQIHNKLRFLAVLDPSEDNQYPGMLPISDLETEIRWVHSASCGSIRFLAARKYVGLVHLPMAKAELVQEGRCRTMEDWKRSLLRIGVGMFRSPVVFRCHGIAADVTF